MIHDIGLLERLIWALRLFWRYIPRSGARGLHCGVEYPGSVSKEEEGTDKTTAFAYGGVLILRAEAIV